jgi:hypothetical protein
MKTVYVVLHNDGWEYNQAVGVYTDLREAKKYVMAETKDKVGLVTTLGLVTPQVGKDFHSFMIQKVKIQ